MPLPINTDLRTAFDLSLSFSLIASRASFRFADSTFAVSFLLSSASASWVLYLEHFFLCRLRPPCVLNVCSQYELLHA